jgi:hypothetical protein
LCTPAGQVDTCTTTVDGLLPGGEVYLHVFTPVDGAASGSFTNSIEVTGGGAPQDLVAQQVMRVAPPDPFAFKTFTTSLTKADGSPALQAASDPADITTKFSVPSYAQGLFGFVTQTAAVEQFKDIVAHLPAGLLGNPTTVPHCTTAQLGALSGSHGEIPQCPLESQVGIVRLANSDLVPLYNMVAPAGSPAAFGFEYQSVMVVLIAKVRPDDHGIDIIARNAVSSVPIAAVDVTFWGVPGDSSHDNLRGVCLDGYAGNNGLTCPLANPSRVAFLRLPTSCSGPLGWGIEASSYAHPDVFVHAQTSSPAMTGCGLVPFGPSLKLTPSAGGPHQPTGLDANMTIPQGNGPDGLAEADLKTVAVTLPNGLVINPSSATGLQACTDAQLGLGSDAAASCPDGSKLGSVKVTTPVLDHPIGGSIFLRTQNSDDPFSGKLFRIAIEIRSDDDGIDIKQEGQIQANPLSGQITTTFDQIPQLPLSSLDLRFKSGPRAPLTTPDTCASASNASAISITSWSNTTLNSSDGFGLAGDCQPLGFSPALSAGTQDPTAGKDSPFLFSLTRGDGDQQFHTLTVKTPTGLLGRIKNAELCGNDQASAGTCGDASQIGSVTVGAGSGTNPFFLTGGRVYLTGPYNGGPYGLSVVVHALAGPFDLGTVTVRSAIFVDPNTTALRVVTDALPTILKGVPLDIRVLRIALDKRGFMFNPTSCTAKHIDVSATSTQGTTANLTSPFQVSNCANLRLAPKVSFTVGSKHHTAAGVSTPFSTTITQPAKGATNLKSISVTLPGTMNARLPVVNRACKLTEFQAGHCTTKAKVGTAVLTTPVLKDPLRGSVFFVKNPARVLPDLMIALRGQVSIDLTGKVSIPGGKRLATRFDTTPDAPFTKFTLNIVSGKNGPVGVVTNLCTKKGRAATAALAIRGHNNALTKTNPRLHINGCTPKKHR